MSETMTIQCRFHVDTRARGRKQLQAGEQPQDDQEQQKEGVPRPERLVEGQRGDRQGDQDGPHP